MPAALSPAPSASLLLPQHSHWACGHTPTCLPKAVPSWGQLASHRGLHEGGLPTGFAHEPHFCLGVLWGVLGLCWDKVLFQGSCC